MPHPFRNSDRHRPVHRRGRAIAVTAVALAFGLGGIVQAQASSAASCAPAASALHRSLPISLPGCPSDGPVEMLGVRWQ